MAGFSRGADPSADPPVVLALLAEVLVCRPALLGLPLSSSRLLGFPWLQVELFDRPSPAVPPTRLLMAD